ncbi:hypothetical protein LTR28_005669 [Elasticomyces elasticus]|nr:hypothetical protein LTR28_005669 [Elasticomyces elasticus]
MREPELRYFVRTFEVWAIRTKPGDWTWDSLGFGSREWEDGQPHEAEHDYSAAIGDQSFFGPEELTNYQVFLQESLGFATAFANRCIDRIVQGDDQPLKTMLMALCSRLNTIVFVNKRQFGTHHNPFELLDHTFRNLYQRHEHQQPWHYFQNVRRVITGVAHPAIWTHGCWYHPFWSENASLFLLPSIQNLTFDMTNFDNIGGTYQWEWAPRVSNICELVFDANANGDAETFDSLMSGVKALRVIRGFNWGIKKSQFIDSLGKHQSHCVEELSLADFHINSIANSDEMAKLKELTSLRTIHLALTDFISGAPYLRTKVERENWMRSNPDPAVMIRLTDTLPCSIENVRFSGVVDVPVLAESRSFLQMLNELVSSKFGGRYMALRHLCIACIRSRRYLDGGPAWQAQRGLQMTARLRSGLQPSGTEELTALRECCEANGVALHGWDPISYRNKQPCSLCTDHDVVELSPVLGYDGW